VQCFSVPRPSFRFVLQIQHEQHIFFQHDLQAFSNQHQFLFILKFGIETINIARLQLSKGILKPLRTQGNFVPKNVSHSPAVERSRGLHAASMSIANDNKSTLCYSFSSSVKEKFAELESTPSPS
jgi:hypothetical protein